MSVIEISEDMDPFSVFIQNATNGPGPDADNLTWKVYHTEIAAEVATLWCESQFQAYEWAKELPSGPDRVRELESTLEGYTRAMRAEEEAKAEAEYWRGLDRLTPLDLRALINDQIILESRS